MTPLGFKGSFGKGARGRDQAGVKRTLILLGHTKVKSRGPFGATAVAALKTFQRKHKLKADGVYGPATHAKLAPKMTGYARWLYAHAKPRRQDHGGVGGSSFSWAEIGGHGKFTVPLALRPGAIIQARRLQVLNDRINDERRKHKLIPTKINTLSWYRPLWYNRQIGGARLSKHILAIATDISREEVDRLTGGGKFSFDAIADQVYSRGGFGQYPGGSRHMDSRGVRARWSSF